MDVKNQIKQNKQKNAFCNTFDLHYARIGLENQFLVFFLSDHLRQVSLYFYHASNHAEHSSEQSDLGPYYLQSILPKHMSRCDSSLQLSWMAGKRLKPLPWFWLLKSFLCGAFPCGRFEFLLWWRNDDCLWWGKHCFHLFSLLIELPMAGFPIDHGCILLNQFIIVYIFHHSCQQGRNHVIRVSFYHNLRFRLFNSCFWTVKFKITYSLPGGSCCRSSTTLDRSLTCHLSFFCSTWAPHECEIIRGQVTWICIHWKWQNSYVKTFYARRKDVLSRLINCSERRKLKAETFMSMLSCRLKVAVLINVLKMIVLFYLAGIFIWH